MAAGIHLAPTVPTDTELSYFRWVVFNTKENLHRSPCLVTGLKMPTWARCRPTPARNPGSLQTSRGSGESACLVTLHGHS